MKHRPIEDIFRQKAPKISWCPNCNVPVIRRDICDKCGSRTVIVRGVAYPRDVRYCFENDLEIIIESLRRYYELSNSEISKLIDRNEVVLLNKIQHIDSADQIISRGRVIGVRYYDISKREWMFRPDYAGIKIMIEGKMGYYVIINRKNVVEGEYVDKTCIVEGELPNLEDIYIPFKLKDHEVYGISQLRGNKIRIVKVLGKISYSEVEEKNSNIYDTIRANIQNIETLEKNSLKIVEEAIRKYSTWFKIVTYSGGKDSTVITYLASQYKIDRFVFCDTTLEFPETYETVDNMSKIVNIDHVEASREVFEKTFEVLGPPARDFRWCTQICKLIPLKNYLRHFNTTKSKVLSITGQRMFESPQRALAGYETEVYGPNPADIIVSPLYDWTALEIEMYIHHEKLPLNKLYTMGFERVGCFICPTLRISEIDIVRKYHPELWSWWQDKLRKYRKKFKLPDTWLKYELWRWRLEIPGDLRNYLKKVGGYVDIIELPNPIINVKNVELNDINNETTIDAVLIGIEHLDFNKICDMLPIISRELYIRDNHIKIYTKHSIITVFREGKINVWSRDLEIAKNILEIICKIIYMTHRCLKCEECVYACPRNVLEVDEHPKVIDSHRCEMCRECVKSCVMSKYIGITVQREIDAKLAL